MMRDMRFHHSLSFGFILGFLFGTLGLWILAMLSLAFPPVELVAQPLFAFGRWLSDMAISDGSANNVEVGMLIVGNGVLYGVLGMLIQKIDRKLHKA